MRIKYLSHAAFLIAGGGSTVLIDPFLTGNPLAAAAPGELTPEYIFVTHAHGDHIGDAMQIAKSAGSTVISTAEIAGYFAAKGVKSHGMHIGGAHKFPFGRVKLTIAHHGSSMPGPDGPVSLGIACGVLITMDGKTVYHPGDTGLFMDMKLIGEINRIDAALLPIGDNYTMGIDDAVKAAEFLKPALAVPMHYDTFDLIKADPAEFVKKVEAAGGKAKIVKPGEEFDV